MKMLYGVYQPTAGNLYIDGEQMERWNPTIAREKGIGMVFQDFRLSLIHISMCIRDSACTARGGVGVDAHLRR